MESIEKGIKITIGQLELWTAPFGKDRATITATEGGTKIMLLQLHKKMPEDFQLFVEDEDFCKEDMDCAFSVIVDPKVVTMEIEPGKGEFSFRIARECEDCDGCEECDDCGTAEGEANE